MNAVANIIIGRLRVIAFAVIALRNQKIYARKRLAMINRLIVGLIFVIALSSLITFSKAESRGNFTLVDNLFINKTYIRLTLAEGELFQIEKQHIGNAYFTDCAVKVVNKKTLLLSCEGIQSGNNQ